MLILLPAILCAQASKEQLANIRAEYADIESRLDSCTIVKETDWVDEEDYEGGIPIVNGYYDSKEGNYIKITERLEGDWREKTTSYYLNDGKVFFVFVKGYYGMEMYTARELGLTEQQLWQSGGVAKTLMVHETRVYLSEDHVVSILGKEQEIQAVKIDFDLSQVGNVERSGDSFSGQFMRKHLGKAIRALEERRMHSK